MSLSLRLHRPRPERPLYLKLAEETCLTRRRAAGLYLHAAGRPAYLACFVASLFAAALLMAYGRRAPGVGLRPPPSQQAVALTKESRTPRGYPRRYISHVVKAGDTYYLLAQRYYGGLSDSFVRHYGKEQSAWEVIRNENPRANQPPFKPDEIPVTLELRIPLP
jgi:hypothetical protein